VWYDYERDSSGNVISDATPPGPSYLREALGTDFFADVVGVNLSRSRFGDGLAPVEVLRNLEVLILDYADVTDADLDHLRGLTKLRELSLTSDQVTDIGLQRIGELTNLTHLCLDRSQISDAELCHLSGLNRLELLFLDNTEVTDAALEYVAALSELRYLSLGGTKVSDAGLAHLEAMPNLKWLNLRHTGITAERVAQLKKAMPNCEIFGSEAPLSLPYLGKSSIQPGLLVMNTNPLNSFEADRCSPN